METAEDLEYLVAVGTAVESVLVLNHRHVTLIQCV